MKKSEAKPGTKVLASYGPAYEEYTDEQIVKYRHDGDYGALVGVIRSKPAKAGHVWVKWIEGEYLDSLDGGDAEGDVEVDLKILTLESDRSKIEAEYDKVSKEVAKKMKAAAALINEAGKLARSAHATLSNMTESYAIVDAMDNNGWRSSSWGC